MDRRKPFPSRDTRIVCCNDSIVLYSTGSSLKTACCLVGEVHGNYHKVSRLVGRGTSEVWKIKARFSFGERSKVFEVNLAPGHKVLLKEKERETGFLSVSELIGKESEFVLFTLEGELYKNLGIDMKNLADKKRLIPLEIVSIEKEKAQPVFDIEVEGSHSLIVEHIIIHNSFI